MQYKLEGEVWVYPGAAAWHFVSVEKSVAREVRELFAHRTRGFGSIRVIVRVGGTQWKTSIFPDSKSGTYLLPLKSEVRRKEKIREGDTVSYTLELQP